MVEERKQERAGFRIDIVGARPTISISGDVLMRPRPEDNQIDVMLRSLDEVEALRDALTAFLSFHRTRQSPTMNDETRQTDPAEQEAQRGYRTT